MDGYDRGVGIPDSSNLQDLDTFSGNRKGDTVFDASQYAFFGNNVGEEVEIGGLEDDEDVLEPVKLGVEEFPLEREESDALGSLSNIDDLSITFSKLNGTPGLAGFSGDLGPRESSSAVEWKQGRNFSDWFDESAIEAENNNEGKKWSSQPYSSAANYLEPASLYRTVSHPDHHKHLPQQNSRNTYSSEPFTLYPPPGGRLISDSPNDQSKHSAIMYQPDGLQTPVASNNPPFSNSQLQLNSLNHGSQFGGTFPQLPHGHPGNGRFPNQWLHRNSQYPGDSSGLLNNTLPQQLLRQNGTVPPQLMFHQRSLQSRNHHPYQPSMTQASGLQSQLFSSHPSLSPPPMMNNFEMRGSPDLWDQRALSMLRNRQGTGFPHQGPDLATQKGGIGWPRFKSKYMSTEEIENIFRSQLAATYSSDPYVEDYYHQACLARKFTDAKLKHYFCPTNLNDGPARTRVSTEPHAFLQVDALGRVSFSSIRRPRPLLEVDSSSSSSIVDNETKFAEKPLEWEPMLAARVVIEDGISLLLDVDDIDRFLQFNQQHDGGAQLRHRRQVLLEGLASSLQLVDPLGKNGSTVDIAPKDDYVFLRMVSLPKGKKLLLRYLQLLSPGELTRVVCMAIFRNLRFIFGNLPADPGTSATTLNLVKTISSCILSMDLKDVAACLASVVCSVEHPMLCPVGSPGDGSTVVLKSILERATELLTDPLAAGNCSMATRTFWQASFDAFFGILTKYCFDKYESVVHSTPDIGSDVAKAISKEMPVELLRASLPHTNEHQRKVLLEFARRSMPGSASGNPSQ